MGEDFFFYAIVRPLNVLCGPNVGTRLLTYFGLLVPVNIFVCPIRLGGRAKGL